MIAIHQGRRRDCSAPLLVMLHEDGADERLLPPIGRRLWKGAPLTSLRGVHRDGEGWRFLSTPADTAADLGSETSLADDLASVIRDAAKRHFQLVEVIGVGMRGGADALTALLCRHPAALSAALLCRPGRTWSQTSYAALRRGNGIEVLIVVEPAMARLAMEPRLLLSSAGHNVVVTVAAMAEEVNLGRAWLRRELRGESGDDRLE